MSAQYQTLTSLSFPWTNLNPLHIGIRCAKFWWNWPSGSKKRRLFKVIDVFPLYPYYFPLVKRTMFFVDVHAKYYVTSLVYKRWNGEKFITKTTTTSSTEIFIYAQINCSGQNISSKLWKRNNHAVMDDTLTIRTKIKSSQRQGNLSKQFCDSSGRLIEKKS